ncbi:MAG: SDR family oxidoreductase [Acidimicrobiia bacterium]
MGLLDGKVAIVTGAGRGIGRGEAVLLASHGASVVVNDVGGEWDGTGADDRPATQVVEEITEAGGRAVANGDDVADWEGAQRLIQTAIDTFGDLHILVNNAGILRDGMSFNLDEEAWDSVIRVHLKGHFAPSHHAARYWREQSKAGVEVPRRIINTTSESGLFGNAGQANYSAAKAGIASLSIVLSRELAKYGVTVNCVAPRARTRMTAGTFGGFDEPGDDTFDEWSPDNIAPTVGFLASDEAGDITGQVFVVWADRVHLMTGWSPVHTAEGDGKRWTVEGLVAQKSEMFADRDRGSPPMGFGL